MSTQLQLPAKGTPLVDLEAPPRIAAQWAALEAAFDAHTEARKSARVRDQVIGFACGIAPLIAASWVESKPAQVLCLVLMVLGLGLCLWLVIAGRTTAPHFFDDIWGWEFRTLSDRAYPDLLAKAQSDQVVARYLQAVLAEGRPLRRAEESALRGRVDARVQAASSKALDAEAAAAREALQKLSPAEVQLAEDRRVAVDFYSQNPTAALFDFNKRLAGEAPTARP